MYRTALSFEKSFRFAGVRGFQGRCGKWMWAVEPKRSKTGIMENKMGKNGTDAIRVILGYLNFSSGSHEPRFWTAWNLLFSSLSNPNGTEPLWSEAVSQLLSQLDVFSQTDEVFRSSDRARFVLVSMRDCILPAYRAFHTDLLFHQKDDLLFNSFFLAKVCEQTLLLESLWKESEQFSQEVIRRLNDYIGYRPIPVLEGEEKHEANPHEWVAPIVLYRQGVGAAVGPYHDLVEKTFEIFEMTDRALLQDAWFDPGKVQELVVDPRAYDFDHPVNRRPNYGFGTWDPNFIDKEGYYHRFVVHQVTLDGIFQRTTVNEEGLTSVTAIPSEELLLEAASVLAGTMLMGSGVSGDHVQTHDSTVTLMTLMPFIASYRDRFYEQLINQVPESMRNRLKQEEKKYFQPFAGARQSLNRFLAKKRADQLQRFHLARTYARMGYFEAGRKQAAIIEVMSARFLCRMDCLIAQAHLLVDQDKYKEAVELLPELEDLLHRGIACGALADPWTILGFSGEYSLFPSADSTIHDHRLDDLIGVMNDIFDVQSRLQKEAAASGDSETQSDISERMSDLASWWDQFGSTEVSSVDGFWGEAVWESAAKVSTALATWHQAGPAAGDVAFWRRHVERFQSPKAFVLLGEALLDQKDLISTMALLMHWLSQSETIALTEGDYSFHSIAARWFELLWRNDDASEHTADDKNSAASKGSNKNRKAKPQSTGQSVAGTVAEKWKLMKSFVERLEANADHYWQVPELELDSDFFDSQPAPGVASGSSKPGMADSVSGVVSDSDSMEDEEMFGPFGDFVAEKECRSFQEWYSLTMEALPSPERGARFPELARYMPKLRRKDFPWKVLCRLYALHREIRDVVWANKGAESVRLFADRRYGILLFVDGFLQLVRFILCRTNMKIASTEPLSLEPASMENYIKAFDDLLGDNPSDFLNELSQTDLPSKSIEVFQTILDIFLMYNDLFGEENGDDLSPNAIHARLDGSTKNRDLRFEPFEQDDDELDDSGDDLIYDYEDEFYDDFYEEETGEELEPFELDPSLEIDSVSEAWDDDQTDEDEDDEDDRGIDPLYRAAYDQVTFRDSAEDGTDDETMDSGGSVYRDGDDNDLSRETDRINDRLAFIYSIVRMWKFAAGKSLLLTPEEEQQLDVRAYLVSWLKQSRVFRDGLYELLDQTSRYRVPKPSGTSDSMMEYDHHRGTKEILLDRIIWSIVEVSDAILLLEAFLFRPEDGGMLTYDDPFSLPWELSKEISQLAEQDRIVRRCREAARKEVTVQDDIPAWFSGVRDIMSSLYRSDHVLFRMQWHHVLRKLEQETLLYIPTSRGGQARAIVNCRCLQQVVLRLFESLPRQGLLIETFELLRTVQNMERIRPTLPGAITEFDRLFETATKGIADCIAFSAKQWPDNTNDDVPKEKAVVDLAEKSVDVLLTCWLSHSKHIRISAVESIMNELSWRSIKSFIVTYGEDLFTQHFLAFRNIRAILHQGVKTYLRTLIHVFSSEGELEFGSRLVADLTSGKVDMNHMAGTLELILECIAENYSVYIDYNSTTTQSDHGDKLYMLVDMLRVLTAYERISWNLKPVYWIHDTLIRGDLNEIASLWEKNIARKSAGLSNENLKHYRKLNEEYGIWLPSIYERLEERFVRPLHVDRMLGLVSQAIKDVRGTGPSAAFEKLESLVEEFASSPMGVGFEVPDWLNDLEEEVVNNQYGGKQDDPERPGDYFGEDQIVGQVALSLEDITRQIVWSDKKIYFDE